MTRPPGPPRWLPWLLLGGLVAAQVGYPLVAGAARTRLVVVTVLLGYAVSVAHALLSRGWRVAAALLALTTVGGFAVEAVGAGTGFPFGAYDYSPALGPRLAGVPLVVPLAWTWMAWPSWLAAVRLTGRRPARVGLAAAGLAAWDLFLDPQMVAAGYWRWADPAPVALPGVPDVPVGNYLGWFAVAALMMAGLCLAAGRVAGRSAKHADAPMHALYLWTYAGSVLAHALFLDLPGSAAWGGLAMGAVAVPLAVTLAAARPTEVRSDERVPDERVPVSQR